MVRGLAIAVLLSTALAMAGEERREDVSNLRIDDPETFWRDGYFPLVPAIHPPTTHDREDLIQVWLKLPPGGKIGVRWLEKQQRYTLTYVETRACRTRWTRSRST
jgi:hypothetical protein